MLTSEQKNWLGHLSDTEVVKIIPYDPRVKEVFAAQKREICSVLGEGGEVLHLGASSLGISGKGDVDIYIPVSAGQFDSYVESLKKIYGEPGSHYPLERVRWNRMEEDIEVEIFVVNEDAVFWRGNLIFTDYLRTHPDVLEEYKKLKEEADGTTSREYYTRKTVFINHVMDLIENGS